MEIDSIWNLKANNHAKGVWLLAFLAKKINASSPALYTLVDQNQDTKETYVMNIIRQKNTENELQVKSKMLV